MVSGLGLGQLLQVGIDQVGQLVEDLGSLLGVGLGPGGEGLLGRRHRCLHLPGRTPRARQSFKTRTANWLLTEASKGVNIGFLFQCHLLHSFQKCEDKTLNFALLSFFLLLNQPQLRGPNYKSLLLY